MSTSPTIVLVHGAFADSSSWNGVAARLRADGFPVVAVANPLRGLSSDAEYTAAVTAAVDGPVVLVGHSYGGSVITNAARGLNNVTSLVYIAGFAPDAGETVLELSGRFPGATLGETLEEIKLPGGGVEVRVRQELFHQQFAADVDADTAAAMAVAQRPVTIAALSEESGEPAWRTLPSHHLVPSADKNIPAQAMAFMAERAGGTVETVEGGSHAVLVSQPETVARFIERAASATA